MMHDPLNVKSLDQLVKCRLQ